MLGRDDEAGISTLVLLGLVVHCLTGVTLAAGELVYYTSHMVHFFAH
jgi:hypothetical protein